VLVYAGAPGATGEVELVALSAGALSEQRQAWDEIDRLSPGLGRTRLAGLGGRGSGRAARCLTRKSSMQMAS